MHALVHRLIAEDKIQGLRIDHVDGLHDPIGYLQRLRRLIREAQRGSPRPFMLLIEKILGENESLQGFEVCDGTTGYEWLNHFSQVLLFPEGHTELKEIWRQVSNLAPSFEPVLIDAKRRVLETLLVSEFTVLTRLLARIAAGHYSTRDYSEDSLRQALTLFVLHFPVYRTYIRGRTANARDRRTIELAVNKARADWFAADAGIFDFLRDAITLDLLLPGRAAAQPRSRAPLRRKTAAIYGTVDGEVAGRYGVLSFSAAACPERSRRQSGRGADAACDLSRAHVRARAPLAQGTDCNGHP